MHFYHLDYHLLLKHSLVITEKAPQLDTYKKSVQLTRLEALQRVPTWSLSGGGLSMAGEISKLGKGPGQWLPSRPHLSKFFHISTSLALLNLSDFKILKFYKEKRSQKWLSGELQWRLISQENTALAQDPAPPQQAGNSNSQGIWCSLVCEGTCMHVVHTDIDKTDQTHTHTHILSLKMT